MTSMNDLVIMKSQQAVTTSKIVADSFEKRHDSVLRDVDKLKKDLHNFAEMFQESTAKDSYGRDHRIYYMNRDGFTLLAMGYTGKKALQFKVKYIDAFNQMEKYLQEPRLPKTPDEKIQLLLEASAEDAKDRKQLNQRMTKVEKTVADIKDKAQVDEAQRYQLLQARKSKVISACGGAKSNYYIEKKAKKVFSEFGRDFKNEFEIPRYDCLKAKDFDEAMKFTKNWYPSFVLQREIQNINAQTRLDFEDRG